MIDPSTRRRITFITQWFAPEPSVQPVRIARTLRDRGHGVEVLTGIPNYPTGRVAAGYRAHRRMTESWESMGITRAPLVPSHSGNSIGRMVNYISWALSAAVFGRRALRDSDVALVYSSPATAALPAMVARRRYGVPYVLLVQDVWPDSIFASGFLTGRARAVGRLLTMFVDRTYEQAARIAVISPGMRELLIERGVDPAKIVLAYNSVDDSELIATDQAPLSRSDWDLDEADVVFMYAGNHGAAQDLGAVVQAFGDLPAESRARLVMVGDGLTKRSLQELAERIAPGRVVFRSPVPREQMAAVMNLADFQVVALADRPLFSVTMPSKVQSILAAGQPVLAVARGDVADAVRHSGAGAVASPGDATEIGRVVRTLAELPVSRRRDLGEAGAAYYRSEMSPDRSADVLITALIDAAEAREQAQARRRS